MATEALTAPQANGAPRAASGREYLRSGLPSVYRHPPDAFAMRFLTGLEEVLDPIVAMLDLLPAHLDPRVAPPEVVAMVADWLGLELDGALPIEVHRRLVDEAKQIIWQRGTRPGVELLLRLAFADLDLEVRETGGATWSTDPAHPQPVADPALTIVCPRGLVDGQRAAIRRVIEEVRPVGVGLELVEREEAA